MSSREVKLGRKIIQAPGIHHWAVKVGNTWYEIEGAAKEACNSANAIGSNEGDVASSGAGLLGGELVGHSDKSNEQIQAFNDRWLRRNPTYYFTTENCQKYAIELIRWATDGNFRLLHELEAGHFDNISIANTMSGNSRGQAFAVAHLGKAHASYGVISANARAPSADVEAIAGPGFGAWANVSAARVDATVGPFGAHLDLNANTGVGVRGGNLDVHVLGLGFKAGADGVTIDTPVGGAKCVLQ